MITRPTSLDVLSMELLQERQVNWMSTRDQRIMRYKQARYFAKNRTTLTIKLKTFWQHITVIWLVTRVLRIQRRRDSSTNAFIRIESLSIRSNPRSAISLGRSKSRIWKYVVPTRHRSGESSPENGAAHRAELANDKMRVRAVRG
jgi:hypothetical protein